MPIANYQPPNATVVEVPGVLQTSPLLASVDTVCIVGVAQGFLTVTDLVPNLTGTTTQVLPTLAALNANVPPGGPTYTLYSATPVTAITDAINPVTGPYTVAYTGSGSSFLVNTAAGTIARQTAGGTTTPVSVYVTYTYVSSDYYAPIRYTDQTSVQRRFGPEWNANGVNSPLSLAASLAFQNGAPDVVLAPLFYLNAGVPTAAIPNSASTGGVANVSTWQTTLAALQGFADIALLAPVIGQGALANGGDPSITETIWLALAQQCLSHVSFMAAQQSYVQLFLGEDSSSTPSVGSLAQIRGTPPGSGNAQTLAGSLGGLYASQTCMMNWSSYQIQNTAIKAPTVVPVGGQYAAAALAGVVAGSPPGQPLTRAPISGFVGITNQPGGGPELFSDLNIDGSVGLVVLMPRGNNILVRQALTLDTTSVDRQELSVVRAKHFMMESIQQTLDTQIVGQIVADSNAVGTVKTTVIGVLQQLVGIGAIVAYSAVLGRMLTLNPTIIEIQFAYSPAFPVNYIKVFFSVNLATGAITPSTPATSLIGA